MTSEVTTVSKVIETEEPPDIPKEDDDKNKEVEVLFDDAFHVIDQVIAIGGLGGLYKRDTIMKASNKLLYLIGLMNINISMCGQFLVLVFFFLTHQYTVRTTCEMLPCFFTSIFSVAKSLLLIVKREKICTVILDLAELWPKTKIDFINKIVRDNMIPAKTYCQIYMYATINVAIVYSLIPVVKFLHYEMFSHDKQFRTWNEVITQPYVIWYPFDYGSAAWKFILTYISQFYAGIFVTVMLAGVDCLFCLLMAHVTMHFLLLQRRIRNLNMAHDNVTLEEAQKDVQKELMEIVEYHNQLYIVSNKIEEIFGLILFVNLAMSSLIICLALFCLTIAPKGLIVKYIVFLASPLLEISLKCYYGNRLIEESRAVREAAYDCSWVDSSSLRTAVLMLQIRADKPAEISAKGFTNASFETFASILRASWSYFTLLHNVYGDSNIE